MHLFEGVNHWFALSLYFCHLFFKLHFVMFVLHIAMSISIKYSNFAPE